MVGDDELKSLIASYPLLMTLSDVARLLKGEKFPKRGQRKTVSTRLAREILDEAGVKPVFEQPMVIRTDRETHLPIIGTRARYQRRDVVMAFFKEMKDKRKDNTKEGQI